MYTQHRILELIASETAQLADAPASVESVIRLGRIARVAEVSLGTGKSPCAVENGALLDLMRIAAPWRLDRRSMVEALMERLVRLEEPIVLPLNGRKMVDLIVARDDAESVLEFLYLTSEDDDHQDLGFFLSWIDQDMESVGFDPWKLPAPAAPIEDVRVVINHAAQNRDRWWSSAMLPLAMQPTGMEHRTVLDKWLFWTASLGTLSPSERARVPQSIQRRLQRAWDFTNFSY